MPTEERSLASEIARAKEQHDEAQERFDAAQADFDAARFQLGVAKSELDAARARLTSLYELEDAMSVPMELDEDSERPPVELADMSRTDAIISILKDRGEHMSISEVLTELQSAHDADVGYQVVASTLNYLMKEGRVVRPTRGRYAVR